MSPLSNLRVVGICGSLVLGTASLKAQDCSLIARYGLYDFAFVDHGAAKRIATLDWLKRMAKRASGAEMQVNASSYLPLGDIPVEAGFDFGNAGWEQMASQLESLHRLKSEQVERLIQSTQRINAQVVAAWKDCETQRGFHARLRSSDTHSQFTVEFDFVPSGSVNAVQVRLEPSASVTCNRRALTVTASGDAVICARRRTTTGAYPAGFVVIRATERPVEGLRFDLPSWQAPQVVVAEKPLSTQLSIDSSFVPGPASGVVRLPLLPPNRAYGAATATCRWGTVDGVQGGNCNAAVPYTVFGIDAAFYSADSSSAELHYRVVDPNRSPKVVRVIVPIIDKPTNAKAHPYQADAQVLRAPTALVKR